ncbi:reverse transcriptase domain-containing protein [Tanacetum coccineum]|uniref:Reverse transcriptase domain-containing protein n=1 Tax=Tanacetum coccineum TaxID=301880 RepID=A0ABQ5AKW4_9ASTR
MSSPNRSTSNIKDAFSSINILNYTSVSSDYFPALSGSISFNSSKNSNIIPSNQTCNLVSPSSSVYTPTLLRIPPKRTSTSETPAITLDALRQLIADFTTALEAQAAAMANADNPNRNTGPREPPYAEDRVTFATGTLTNDALSWWNAYAQPNGIEQANRITWTELKELLTNKYCPRTEVKKMEDEFYNLVVKGNDLKNYIRRFQELAILCPNMVPNAEKLVEVFINGLRRSIEGNVTASKPQTLEEAINIAQRLMDQIIKRNSILETNDRKRKLEDERNIINNNYENNHNNNNRNNDYHRQQNRRQETFKTYTATNGYAGNLPLCNRLDSSHVNICSDKCQVFATR